VSFVSTATAVALLSSPTVAVSLTAVGGWFGGVGVEVTVGVEVGVGVDVGVGVGVGLGVGVVVGAGSVVGAGVGEGDGTAVLTNPPNVVVGELWPVVVPSRTPTVLPVPADRTVLFRQLDRKGLVGPAGTGLDR
jgi:hypothetical protein